MSTHFAVSSLVALAMSSATPARAASGPDVGPYLRNVLHLTRFTLTFDDLNGDGRPEAIVWAQQPDQCGSGGCSLYVLTPEGNDYRLVTKISVTRLPIQVLPTSSHGWHDLAVFVAGGGIRQGYVARLKFDGRTYPTNPTVPPAERADGVRGRPLLEP